MRDRKTSDGTVARFVVKWSGKGENTQNRKKGESGFQWPATDKARQRGFYAIVQGTIKTSTLRVRRIEGEREEE